jgi:hypothetical protein
VFVKDQKSPGCLWSHPQGTEHGRSPVMVPSLESEGTQILGTEVMTAILEVEGWRVRTQALGTPG